ncbi:unnamed protein product [Notodromas monacha]|uniref:RmlD-like substrate binding domain-containing protein n=1 Tax=Notodromas monacha TaxID=399045 RepID=A0A7R9G8T4_9CRUS|nr:unnamed protein product [Notodromas monacha]CAG0913551.1 unnamed protein product [Notodromas monacha]
MGEDAESVDHEAEHVDGLSRLSFNEEQFFHLPSQGNVYGFARIAGAIGENEKFLMISSAMRKVFLVDSHRKRRGVRISSMREIQFTYIPANAEIVAVDALNRSYSVNDFVVALTLVRKNNGSASVRSGNVGEDGTAMQHLNIYSTWEPNSSSTLETVSQSCHSIPLQFTPLMLRHAKAYAPSTSGGRRSRNTVPVQEELGWLLSGSDCKVHFYLEDRAQSLFFEPASNKLFPEFNKFPSPVLWFDLVYLGNCSKRLTAIGCECGFVAVSLVDTWMSTITGSWRVQHDGPVTHVALYQNCSPDFNLPFNMEVFKNGSNEIFVDPVLSMDEIDFNLLVANSLQSSCSYRNVLACGLSDEYILPQSQEYDCVTCACVADFDMDGFNEIALGTYGQKLLIYRWKPGIPLDEVEVSSKVDVENPEHPMLIRHSSRPEFDLIFQKTFAYPVLALDYADFTGDGVRELFVSTTRGVAVIQHDLNDVRARKNIMSHKVLITGASGLLGRAIFDEFNEHPEKWNVIGTGFTRIAPPLVKVDLTNVDEIRECVLKYQPHVIIHCAAQRSPDKVNEDYASAERLNVEVSRILAELTKEIHAHLIYISTDYVFDGNSPPYKETDNACPVNKYGLTKLRGEQAIILANPDSVILRIPVLYGDVKELEESAITCLAKAVLNPSPAKISDYEIRCPAYTRDIAKILEGLSSRLLNPGNGGAEVPVVKGIYQWSGKEAFTKYQLAVLMGKILKKNTDHIEPCHDVSSATPRPKDVRMDTSRLDSLGLMFHTPVAEGIATVLHQYIC